MDHAEVALIYAELAVDFLLKAANEAACVDGAFEKTLDDLREGVIGSMANFKTVNNG